MKEVKKKKSVKIISAILAVLMFGLPVPALASQASAVGITPYYNNVATISSTATISSSGQLQITNLYRGLPGKINKVVIETKVEKKTLGIFWFDVEEWADTIYQDTYTGGHTLQLSERGTYRITVKYTFYGNDGSTDKEKQEITKTY